VGLAITSLCLAIYFTRRRAEVEVVGYHAG